MCEVVKPRSKSQKRDVSVGNEEDLRIINPGQRTPPTAEKSKKNEGPCRGWLGQQDCFCMAPRFTH